MQLLIEQIRLPFYTFQVMLYLFLIHSQTPNGLTLETRKVFARGVLALALLGSGVFGITACGQKGPLKLPEDAERQEEPAPPQDITHNTTPNKASQWTP